MILVVYRGHGICSSGGAPAAVSFFSESVFGRGLKLPNWGSYRDTKQTRGAAPPWHASKRGTDRGGTPANVALEFISALGKHATVAVHRFFSEVPHFRSLRHVPLKHRFGEIMLLLIVDRVNNPSMA